MEFKQVSIDELEIIKNFYDDQILNNENIKKYCDWKVDLYPCREDFEEYMKDGCVFALIDEKIVGCVVLVPPYDVFDDIPWKIKSDNYQVIKLLVVDYKEKGKGYSKILLNECINYLKDKVDVIRLDTFSRNKPAQHIYESLGFTCCEIKDVLYDEKNTTSFHFYELGVSNAI